MASQATQTHAATERTGRIIKVGLVELVDDDRATLYGASLAVAAKLRDEDHNQALVPWKRKGTRAVEVEAL